MKQACTKFQIQVLPQMLFMLFVSPLLHMPTCPPFLLFFKCGLRFKCIEIKSSNHF